MPLERVSEYKDAPRMPRHALAMLNAGPAALDQCVLPRRKPQQAFIVLSLSATLIPHRVALPFLCSSAAPLPLLQSPSHLSFDLDFPLLVVVLIQPPPLTPHTLLFEPITIPRQLNLG